MTTQDRWKQALKQIRAQGVQVRQNVRQCCRGCISYEQLGLEQDSEKPYAYTFGGQGNAIRWVDGDPYRDEKLRRIRRGYVSPQEWTRAREHQAYFNWGNGSAQAIKEAFESCGFEVYWSGTDLECVIVKFPEVEAV